MQPTILLFDIDGTLITTGGVGKLALDRAFQALHGRADACAFPLDGMTDGLIVRRGLREIGVRDDAKAVDEVIAKYLAFLNEEVAKADDVAYRLHAGMRRAVDEGLSRQHVAVGLGTGNVREGARIKLSRVGIYDAFRFGGFGCDHDDRAALIRRGAERGAEQLKTPLEACRVVVIGDTPKDVAAANANGAQALGVATGRYSTQELKAAGAAFVFENLEADGAMKALLC